MSIKNYFPKTIYASKSFTIKYCGRDSIIQVRIDLIFIMVPLGEQNQNGGGTDIKHHVGM